MAKLCQSTMIVNSTTNRQWSQNSRSQWILLLLYLQKSTKCKGTRILVNDEQQQQTIISFGAQCHLPKCSHLCRSCTVAHIDDGCHQWCKVSIDGNLAKSVLWWAAIGGCLCLNWQRAYIQTNWPGHMDTVDLQFVGSYLFAWIGLELSASK